MSLSTSSTTSTPVRSLLRPVSWISSGPENKDPTEETIRNHCIEKKTGFWGKRTLLEYLGVAGFILTGILGIFGIKNDSSVSKWLGGIGAAVCAVVAGIGAFCGVGFKEKTNNTENGKPESEKSQEEIRKTKKENYFEDLKGTSKLNKETFLNKVRSLSSLTEDSDKKEAIKVLLQKCEGSDVIDWLSEILSRENLTKDIDNLTESKDFEPEEAIFCLGEIDNPRAFELLSSYLKDEDIHPMFREYAADALSAKQHESVLPTLIDFLNDKSHVGKEMKGWKTGHDGNRCVRERVARELSVINNDIARDALILRLKDINDSEEFRGDIAHILMRRQYGGDKHIKDPKVYKVLYNCLIDENEKNIVRKKIADELGQLAVYPDTVDELTSFLQALEKVQDGKKPIKDIDHRAILSLRTRIIEFKEGKTGVLIDALENSQSISHRASMSRKLTNTLFSKCENKERERIGDILFKYLDKKGMPKEIRQTIIDELGQQSVTPEVKEIVKRFIDVLEKIKAKEGDKAVCDNVGRPVLSALKDRYSKCL